MRERSTIRDVAREAGVGTTTVSRVINGGKLVAPVMRRRVEEVIRELNFQPSHAARSLKQNHSGLIGLIIPRLSDPFFARIANAAQQVCRSRRNILMISTSGDLEEQTLQEIRVFDQQRVDGLILVPPKTQSADFQNYLRQLSDHTVALDLPCRATGISSVQTNNTEAMAEATAHLIGHGRRRILLLVSDPELHTMKERRKGYEQAVTEAGLKTLVCENIYTLEDAKEAIATMRQSAGSIDGVLAANGQIGTLAFQALDALHVNVPRDIAFITFDDFELAHLLRPAVTAMAQPVDEMGRAATEMLFARMESPGQKAKTVRLPSKMVIRNSCGCP